MSESGISDQSKKAIESDYIDPKQIHLGMVGKLAEDPTNHLTDVTPLERQYEAMFRALHESDIIDLTGVLTFFDWYKKLSISQNRSGRIEYLNAIIGAKPTGGVTQMPEIEYPMPMEDKPSIWSKLAFWKKK